MSNDIKYKISNLCHKSPQYKKYFLNIVESTDSPVYFDEIELTYRKMICYKHLLNNKKFNYLDYKSIESLNDALDLLIEEQKINSFIKKSTSTKHRFLFKNNDVINLLKELFREGVDEKTLEKYIIGKISSFKSSKAFFKSLKNFYNNTINYSPEAIIDKISVLPNAFLLAKKDNQLLVEVCDYESIKQIGSASWCIVTSKNYFEQYVHPNVKDVMNKSKTIFELKISNRQFLFFDFNEKGESKQSLIGFTFDPYNNKIFAAHYKDDSNYNHHNTLHSKVKKIFNIDLADFILTNDDLLKMIKEQKSKELSPKNRLILVNKYIKDIDVSLSCYGSFLKKQKIITSQFIKQFINSFLFFRRHKTSNDVLKVIDFYKKYLSNIYTEQDEYFHNMIIFYLISSIDNTHKEYDAIKLCQQLVTDTIIDEQAIRNFKTTLIEPYLDNKYIIQHFPKITLFKSIYFKDLTFFKSSINIFYDFLENNLFDAISYFLNNDKDFLKSVRERLSTDFSALYVDGNHDHYIIKKLIKSNNDFFENFIEHFKNDHDIVISLTGGITNQLKHMKEAYSNPDYFIKHNINLFQKILIIKKTAVNINVFNLIRSDLPDSMVTQLFVIFNTLDIKKMYFSDNEKNKIIQLSFYYQNNESFKKFFNNVFIDCDLKNHIKKNNLLLFDLVY